MQSQQELENIQIQQGLMMQNFKSTPEYALIYNTFIALKHNHTKERQSAMKKDATRENCLYFTGIEDGIDLCVEELDRIIATALEIKSNRDFKTSFQEA